MGTDVVLGTIGAIPIYVAMDDCMSAHVVSELFLVSRNC